MAKSGETRPAAKAAPPAPPKRGAGGLLFLKNWATAPLRTGAQVPSSRRLARAMADAATIRDDQVVVELGPGTGVVTSALLAKGIPPERLVLIELSPDFCRYLEAKFPGVRVVQGDAFTLKQVVAKHVGKRRSVGAVVSSLPLFVYTKEQRISLLNQALDAVGPDGRVVQFTYSTISPFPFEAEKVKTTVTKRIWWNLWPVVVWTYQRKRA